MKAIEVGKTYVYTTQGDNIPFGTLFTVTSAEPGYGVEGIRGDNGETWTCSATELEEDFPLQEASGHDPVNKPKHYQLLPGVEVIDVLDALCDKLDNSTLLYNKEVSYYAQAMGYFMRFMDKNGLEDLKKGRWYIDRIIKNLEAKK